jgi:hypothetical protein
MWSCQDCESERHDQCPYMSGEYCCCRYRIQIVFYETDDGRTEAYLKGCPGLREDKFIGYLDDPA